MNRILLHAAAGRDGISFRTSSRTGKSPHWFYICRNRLDELEHGQTEVTAHDICSFAVLHRDIYAGTVEIVFYWLNSDCSGSVSGYQETVILPYDRLAGFIRDSAAEGGPVSWKSLSMDIFRHRPKLVFQNCRNLREAVRNAAVRRRLVRCIRDNFHWPLAEKIVFCSGFAPYSFNFREYRNGKPGIAGGLILHNPDNLEKAYYSVHT